MSATTTTLSAISKVFYVSDVINKQINMQSVLYDKLYKKWETDASGKSLFLTDGIDNAPCIAARKDRSENIECEQIFMVKGDGPESHLQIPAVRLARDHAGKRPLGPDLEMADVDRTAQQLPVERFPESFHHETEAPMPDRAAKEGEQREHAQAHQEEPRERSEVVDPRPERKHQQVKPVAVKVADDGSPAFRAEVERQEIGASTHCRLSNYLISCPPVTLIA